MENARSERRTTVCTLHEQLPDQHLSSDCQANCDYTFIPPSCHPASTALRSTVAQPLALPLRQARATAAGPVFAGASSDCRAFASCCAARGRLGWVCGIRRGTQCCRQKQSCETEASGSCIFSSVAPCHGVRCTHSLGRCSLGYLVNWLDIQYVWTKGRSEEKRNGWLVSDWVTRSTKSHVPLHSWILLVIPGAVPLQIRAKRSAKKWEHCLSFCKQHQEPQAADDSAGINVGILLLIVIKWNVYNLYVVPRPKAKVVKKLDGFKAILSQGFPSLFSLRCCKRRTLF